MADDGSDARRAAAPSGFPVRTPEGGLPTVLSTTWMSRMLEVVRRLGGAPTLEDALQLVTDGAVDVLGFGAAAINVVRPDGSLRVEAVTGPDDAARTLLGTTASRATWDRALAASQRWGNIHSLRGGGEGDPGELAAWTPAAPPGGDAGTDRWRPEDSLLVPLSGPGGELLGVLSVDAPLDGRNPLPEQLVLLELFAAQAANTLADAVRQAGLRDREAMYRQVFFDAPAPMAVVSPALEVLAANGAFTELLGPAAGPAPGALAERVAGDRRAALEETAALVAAGSGPAAIEHRLVRSDGRVRWVRTTLSGLDAVTGERRLLLRLEDTTQQRRVLEELRREADHDPLTGLPNRRLGRRRLHELLTNRRSASLVTVLYCDLDGFKQVNDDLGHAAGDELLCLVASRLGRVIRPPDLLCREGGDEFVVVAGMPADGRPEAMARRCIDALAGPFALPGGTVRVSMSVGIAAASDRSVSADGLLREADAALYRAKEAGRGRWARVDGAGEG